MKALTIRQPWAELILQGRKTIEIRTWGTAHRGLLGIHASKTIDEAACATYGLDHAILDRGALLGTVELVEIVPLDADRWEALRDQHLSLDGFPGDVVGWRLADPQRVPQPIPMRGRMSLFSVPDELADGTEQPAISTSSHQEADALKPKRRPSPAERYGVEPAYDPEKPFELRVVPRKDADYGLALYQWPIAAHGERDARPEATGPERLVEISGEMLRAVADQVLEALRRAGYKATDLSPTRRQPFRLDEETGLRLGLLFLAIRPLSRMDRVEAISAALRTMPSEEAYYWFSKCATGADAESARRALRILLAGG